VFLNDSGHETKSRDALGSQHSLFILKLSTLDIWFSVGHTIIIDQNIVLQPLGGNT
jgi:hypothetical protein